jgi:succinate dehydrogenase / fumarate reductase, membrane anchor subunit
MIVLSGSGSKSGLRDWILQRLTGVCIGLYVLFVGFYIYIGGFNYTNIITLLSLSYFKIISIIFIFSIVLHASIGIGIIITDYIKHNLLRIIIDFLINIILLSYVFFVMQIIWGF